VNWRRAARIGTVAGAVTLAGVGAVNLAGRHLRRRQDQELDDPLSPPSEVEHLRFSTADGGELHAVVTGAGRPVVLLHGVTLQWWVWSAVIRLLRGRYQVIAWDMRGHGESRAGDRGVSLEACADDLALLLETLDLRDAIVVGHSMGGMCLGRFAAAHHAMLHERVAGLVFLATSTAPLSVTGVRGGLSAIAGKVVVLAERGARRDRSVYGWKDSNRAAVIVGPKMRSPALSNRSTTPAASVSSGPTTVRSM